MDAKVLRAAVSAAIRVTVSTTLIGCGGNVTTDAGGTRAPGKNDAAGTGEPTSSAKDASQRNNLPYPVSGIVSNGAKAGSGAGGAGGAVIGGSAGGATVGSAGATRNGEVGGMANAAGANDESSAGAPAQTCVAAAETCLTTLEQTTAVQPPSAATQACCETVLQAISLPQQLSNECFDSLNTRFMQPGVRPLCCTDPSSWSHQACTPWGPPVPPELSRDALLAWGAAA